jgi:ATP-dependent Clp protease protease subunit
LRFRETLTQILADNCGQTFDRLAKDIDRDYWMSAAEGVEYGIIDEVLGKDRTATK